MKKLVSIFSIIIILFGFGFYQLEKKETYNTVLEISKDKPLKVSLEELAISKNIFFKL